jgi:hypothetical protein
MHGYRLVELNTGPDNEISSSAGRALGDTGSETERACAARMCDRELLRLCKGGPGNDKRGAR